MTDLANRLLGGLKRDEVLAPLAVPVRIGRYDVVRLLGKGAAGEVYLAKDPSISRDVAIKVLKAADHDRRFQREVEILGTLKHPNIVTVFDAGLHEGRPYFVMERLDGGPLADRLPSLDRRRRVEILRDVARAVHAAHEKGVVHRDLKPTNILLDARGPVVTDFGIAKTEDEKLTRTGTAMGTPSYMSPEQAEGRADAVDARSDVFSMGVMLYEMLAGRVPFKGPTVFAITKAIIDDDPPRLDGSELEAVALKAMEKKPERRYASAKAFADELDAWLEGRPVAARSPGLARRAARWFRRHPTVLGILGTVAATLLVIGILAGRSQAERRRIGDIQRRTNDEVQRVLGWDVNLYKPPELVSYDDLAKSIAVLEELETTGHAPASGRYAIGRARMRMGRADLAVADLSAAIARQPTASWVLDRARARWEPLLREAVAKNEARVKGLRDLVFEDFREAKRLGLADPWERDFVEAHLILLEGESGGRIERATALIRGLTEQKNKPAEEAWKLIGDVNLLSRKWPVAIEAYTTALKIRQSYVQAQSGLAITYLGMTDDNGSGDGKAALELSLRAAARAAEMNPAYGETYHIFALACRSLLRVPPQRIVDQRATIQAVGEKLIALFTKGLAARPDLVPLRVALGSAHLILAFTLVADRKAAGAHLDEAETLYTEAARVDAGSLDAQLGLGLTFGVRASELRNAGKDHATESARAEEHLRRAAEVAPSSPDPWRWLGHMYFNRRNGKAAAAAWEKAVELDATLEEEFEPLIERAKQLK